jgi:adenylosuccinate lyase
MSRVEADEEKVHAALQAHWEVVSEGAQTILRATGRSDAYETLKSQTRGRSMDSHRYQVWVEALDVDEATRSRLIRLWPESYLGLAVDLVDQALRESSDDHHETQGEASD